jgi:transcriptional regulator GlxA family with amidase domain
MTHTVAFLVYPGFSLINLSGPASVFDTANLELRMSGRKPLYAIEVASPAGGLVMSNGGIAVHTRALARLPATRVHTALFLGAHMEHLLALTLEPSVRRWAIRCAKAATRFGAVCTGAFVLAGLGLLDGKRAATHWFACALLAEKYPSVTVDADALYVVDGKTWTSAGASAGIDMALAMVGRDLGDGMASQVAKGLVVYARRPGYQSQFSPLLLAQAKADGPFAELTGWLQANLHRPLNVPSLAARLGLSERTFYRKFVAATGVSPAHFIEAVRLDAARTLLSQGLTLKAIAAQVGMAPTARFTRAFERRFGVSPSLFREMHSSVSTDARDRPAMLPSA